MYVLSTMTYTMTYIDSMYDAKTHKPQQATSPRFRFQSMVILDPKQQ